MAKSGFMVVILAVFAGAAAGMAVQLLGGDPGDSESAPTSPAVTAAEHSEVEDIARRGETRLDDVEIAIEALRSENSALKAEIADLREKLATVEETTAETANLPAAGMKVFGPDGEPVKFQGSPGLMKFAPAGKGYKLAGLNEDEKWAKLREELSLDSYQETELKQIAADYKQAMSEMFKTEDGGFKIGKIDLGKIMKAKTDADERVKNLLSEAQYEKYEKEDYGAAIGLGGSTKVSVTTSFGSSEGK